ncbi:hypothetical protein KKE03_05170 [Patescibacteria group bacterium]|nr:hypothetical protein [Patescibacteria group bacterium]
MAQRSHGFPLKRKTNPTIAAINAFRASLGEDPFQPKKVLVDETPRPAGRSRR